MVSFPRGAWEREITHMSSIVPQQRGRNLAMRHFLQLTVALSTTFCLTAALVPLTNVQGEGLRQPAALVAAEAAPAAAAKTTVEKDSQVKPAGCCDGGNACSGGGCCGSGCCCEPVCCPRCVVGEVEKRCWNVKCKNVCIPRFRWPWECRDKSSGGCDADCGCAEDTCCGDGRCGTPPKCGRVRTVNTLEQHKYTCKECGYEWDIKCVCRPKKKHH